MNDAALKPRDYRRRASARPACCCRCRWRAPMITRRTVASPRGTLVAAPLGAARCWAWCGARPKARSATIALKVAEPLEGAPRLPAALCDFIDWVARYTLTPPGAILAMALRSRRRFEPEAPRIAYVRRRSSRRRACRTRARACWGWRKTDWRAASRRLAEEANVTPAVVRGLIEAGALARNRAAGIRALPAARSGILRSDRTRTDDQEARRAQPCAARSRRSEFSATSARRRHRFGQDRSLFRSGGRSAAARQAGADPAAGDRADGAVPRTLRRALRLPPGRMASAIFRRRSAGASIAR